MAMRPYAIGIDNFRRGTGLHDATEERFVFALGRLDSKTTSSVSWSQLLEMLHHPTAGCLIGQRTVASAHVVTAVLRVRCARDDARYFGAGENELEEELPPTVDEGLCPRRQLFALNGSE